MAFEDQITYVIMFGNRSEEYVLSMDVISFGKLTESLLRVRNAEKIENAWTMMAAAQGDNKGMKKWTKKWRDNQPGMPESNDQASFNARFGKGV